MANGKRVLVTGGAGFLGSHLCERLLQDGCSVLCLDNLSTGRMANVAPLLGRQGFSLLEHDVCRPISADVDEIYNLACPASPASYQADPIGTLRTNVVGAMNVLELARERGATVLQASTSEVYGDPVVHPQPESYWGNVNPVGPRACYDEGKRCAETLFTDYHRTQGVSVRIARIFNTYGPRMAADDGRVVSNFVVQALTGQPITLYGDGLQTRAFCYVDDLVEGLIRLMAADGVEAAPVNLGNPDEFTVRELADVVVAATGSASTIVTRPLPCDDPKQRRPDIGLARDRLDWTPATPLAEGLERTIAYFSASIAA